MQESEEYRIIEALLFSSPDPVTQQQINLVFESDPPRLSEIVEKLQARYIDNENAFSIDEIAGGYQLNSKPEYEVWIRRLLNKSGRLVLTSASLESLSIIAYKQPISRYEIEAIRGVDCSGVLKTLLGKKMIHIKGRDPGSGRPLLYGTTDKFLGHFGLSKLSDMPRLSEMKELEEGISENRDQLDAFK